MKFGDAPNFRNLENRAEDLLNRANRTLDEGERRQLRSLARDLQHQAEALKRPH